ncbi:MAG: amino acid-binding protein [Candidatus Thorarchaeota archaeon]|nr:amino acid-binding protein [Candidatus Thorarchaeota archaeon]
MWRRIVDFFKDSPQRLIVAQAIVRHGFSVDGPGEIKCGDIRIPLKSLGNALNIDRRTVRATTEDICSNKDLCAFFKELRPAGPSLEGVRRVLGYGVVTILVESPENPGILSEVTSMIAGYGIPIRQVLAEDVAIYEEPCLKVITQNPLPGRVIETLASIKGVRKVIIDK